jgi:hypothetical protein
MPPLHTVPPTDSIQASTNPLFPHIMQPALPRTYFFYWKPSRWEQNTSYKTAEHQCCEKLIPHKIFLLFTTITMSYTRKYFWLEKKGTVQCCHHICTCEIIQTIFTLKLILLLQRFSLLAAHKC